MHCVIISIYRRQKSPEPEIPDETRDRRTVFVMQLGQFVSNRDLEDVFGKAGKVGNGRCFST